MHVSAVLLFFCQICKHMATYAITDSTVVWIYYTGCAEEATREWCFKDSAITFQDIFALY